MQSDEKIRERDLFYEDILRKPLYWVSMAFIAALSYLFDLVNRTVSIDDLARPYYFGGSEKAAAAEGRWGMALLIRLLSTAEYTPFIDKFIALLALTVSAILYTFILYRYIRTGRQRLALCTLFSCLYISFPLLNEIWNFNATILIMNINTVITAFCVIFLRDETKVLNRKTLLCSFLLSVAAAGYEASVFLYVTTVLSVLLLDYLILGHKKWIRSGIRYSISLIGGIILRYLIGFGLIRIMGLAHKKAGATAVMWQFGSGFFPHIQKLVRDTFICYFLRGLIYFPIFIFRITVIFSFAAVLYITVKRRCPGITVIFILLFLSLFFQSVIQGTVMPVRTAQTVRYFCAVSFTFILFALASSNHENLYRLAFALTVFLCFRQGVFMNASLALNNQRSDNEAAVIYDLGTKIKRTDPDKPVYIVGTVSLGDFIGRQDRPDRTTAGGYLFQKAAEHFGLNFEKTAIYDSNVNSVINWTENAFTFRDIMNEYFSYYGFDIDSRIKNWSEHNDFLIEALENDLQPLEVRDMGDHILVYLGP